MKNNKFEEFKMKYISWVMLLMFLLMGCSPSPEYCHNSFSFKSLIIVIGIIFCLLMIIGALKIAIEFYKKASRTNSLQDYYDFKREANGTVEFLFWVLIPILVFLVFQVYRCFI